MSFLWPWMLVSLALVPLGYVAYREIDRRRRRRIASLGGLGAAIASTRTSRRVRDRIPAALFLAAFAVLCVALARPQASVSLPHAEGTIVLTFDVSGSMAADDVSPSRLGLAKAVAHATVATMPAGVVMGVAAFSDAGLAVLPPTDDQTVVDAAIERLGPALGTSLGEGMRAALDAIATAEAEIPAEYYSNRSPEPSLAPDVEPGSHGSAVIVLLTDGENTAEPDPLSVAQLAAERGIRIHTIGVGTETGATLDLDGFSVHTQLDPAMLQEVSRMTAGTYHHATDAAALPWIYGDLERRLVLRSEWIELTALLAGLGVLLLMAGGVTSLVGHGRLP